MVCENGTMGMISNATTTIATVGTNGTTTLISSGNVLLSGASNVTLSQGGNTISFSAPNGGTSLSNLYWPNDILASTMSSSIIGYVHYVPFRLEQSLAASRAAIIVSIAGASTANTSVRSNQVTLQIGLFTRTGSTLQTVASGSQIYSWSWASTTNTSVIANITGLKRMSVPITVNVAPGDYWYGVWVNQVNTTSASGAVSYLAIGGYNAPLNFLGNVGSASNSSNELVPGLGIYSNATTNALITSVNITDIKSAGTTGWAAEPWILFTNFDVN